MPTENAKRDENYKAVGLGYNGLGELSPLKVDPITGYLLIEVMVDTPTVNVNTDNNALRDENHVPVCLAKEDNVTGNTRHFLIDNRNNRLWVDIA